MKILLYSLALFFFVQTSHAESTKITVNGKEVYFNTLTNKKEIHAAYELRILFKKLMKNVSSCMTSGGTNNKCNCNYKESHVKLNTLVNSALKKYPHWLNTRAIKFNYRGTKGTLYMKGLQKQAALKLQC